MISPQIPKTFNRRAQAINSAKKIKYAQSPKNTGVSSNISMIGSSPRSQPGNVLQERFNTFHHDSFFPNKSQLKNKNTIPIAKSSKKKEEKQSYNRNLLEISSLYEIYNDIKSDEDYYSELDNLIDSLKETKLLLDEKEKALTMLQDQFNQSKIEKEQLQEEVDELKYLFQLVQDPNEEAKKEIQDYKDKIDIMKQDLQIQKDQNLLLKNQISSFKDQIKDLLEKEKKCQDLVDSVQNEKKSLLNSLKEKEEIIQAFNNEDKLNLILHNDNLLEKVNNFEKSDKEKNEQISNLQESISEAREQIQKYVEQKEKSETEIQNLLLNNSELKSKNIEMKNDIRSKEQLIAGLESNNIKFQKTIIEQENSIKELNKTIEITRGMLEKMGEDRKVQVIISENGKIAELEEVLQEKKHCLKNITEQFDQMKKDFEEKNKELTKAQKDLMDQTSITVSFASRLTQKESELNDLQQSQSILNRQMDDLKKKNQSLERLLKNKIEQVNLILREKGKEIIQMQQTINNLTEEKSKSQSQLSNYSEDVKKLNEDIEKFKSSNQNLSKQNQELEEKLSSTSEKLKELESRKVLLESKLTGSSQVIDKMNQKIDIYENSIKDYRKIEADLKQSMQISLTEKQILSQKYEENEIALKSIQKSFEEIKLKYDDLLKNYQKDTKISKNFEEIKLKYDNLLKEFKDQEDQISSLSQNKGNLELEVVQLNEENKNLIYMIESLQNEINNNYDNSSLLLNETAGLKTSLISTPKCANTVSSLQLKIKSQNKKLYEMQKIITELNEFVEVLENQIKNSSQNSSPHCEKEQLMLENSQLRDQMESLIIKNNELHVEVESLEIEKDQLKKELINVKTMTKQLTQVLETFKK